MEALVLIGLIASIVLVLVFLAVVLRLLERAFPAFSAWLDRHVGPDNGSPW